MKRDENQNVEYKESWHDKYLEWICGYANAKGGTLYIGIDDGTKCVVGVRKANKPMEDIPDSIRNKMGIVAGVVPIRKEGKDVIHIKVSASSSPANARFGGFAFDARGEEWYNAYMFSARRRPCSFRTNNQKQQGA